MKRTLAVLVALTLLALPALAKDDALSLVPANAVTVGMVKLADMRSSPLSSLLFEHTDKMTADGEAADFLADAGLSPCCSSSALPRVSRFARPIRTSTGWTR